MKTSWRRLSYSFQDVLIKTNKFVLVIRLQKTSWRRLQDILPRSLQDVSKTPCKNIFKTSSRCLQDIFKTSFKDVLKTFSRRIIRLSCLPRSHLWEIYGQFRTFASVIKIFQVLAQLHGFSFHLLHLLVVAYRAVFKTWPNIYNAYRRF